MPRKKTTAVARKTPQDADHGASQQPLPVARQSTRDLAISATHRRDWQDAQQRWRAILQDDGSNWEALYRLAEASLESGTAGDCIQLARRASAARPHDLRPLILLARGHASAGDFNAAFQSWEKLLQQSPNTLEAWLGKAECAIQTADIAQALASVDRAFSIDAQRTSVSPVPGKLLRLLDLADVRPTLSRWLQSTGNQISPSVVEIQSDRVDDVAADANLENQAGAREWRMLAQSALTALASPTDLHVLAALGRAWFGLGATERAREIFADLTRRAPSNPEAWRWLARALRGLGAHSDAVAAWQRVGTFIPNDREAHLRIMESLAGIGNFVEAIRFGERATSLLPDDIELLRLLARAYMSEGQFEQAFAAWNRLLSRNESDFEGFRSGEIALNVDNDALAEQRLLRAHDLKRADARPALILARHYSWIGRLREARRLLRQALKAQPRNLEIWRTVFDLIRSGARLGLDRRVLARLGRGLSESADDRLFYADLLTASSQVDAASAELSTLLEDEAARVRAAIRLGIAALRRGDFMAADRLASKYLAGGGGKTPVSAEKADFLRTLEECRTFLRARSSTAIRSDWTAIFLDGIRRERSQLADRYSARPGVVLHVLNSLAPGGTELQCALVASSQQIRGQSLQEISVLRTDPHTSGRAVFFLPRLERAGVGSTTLSPFSARARALMTEISALNLAPVPMRSAINTREIASILAAIETLRPEIVHAWTPQCCAYAGIAALIAGVPKIVMRAGSVAPDRRGVTTEIEAQRDEFLRRAMRHVLNAPSVSLISNSGRNLLDWIRWFGFEPGQLAGRSGVIRNLLDVDRLGSARGPRPAELRKRYGLAQGVKLVGAVMRLEREKDPEFWVEIVDLICRGTSNVRFMLVGDGRLRTAIERQLDARGLSRRAILTGTVSDELAAHYALFDLFLLTSRFEGLPNVLLEAQYCGVPVVAPDVGGVREAMDPGRTGIAVGPREPAAFAEAILQVLGDRDRLAGMSTAARAFSAQFEPDRVLASLDEIYGAQAGEDDHDRALLQP